MARWLLLIALAAFPAQAIPAFARRYKTSCVTCHTMPPQLNPFGQAFRAGGYRLPSGEERRQEDDVPLGAPEWEGLFPRSFLPGTLPDVPQIAGFLRAALENLPGTPRTNSIDLLAALLAAGNLGKRASFFAEAGFSNRGAGLSRMWISADGIAGAGSWLGARAGQMEPGVVPWSRFSHRLTYTEYLPFETKIGLLEMGAAKPALEVFGAGADPGPMRGLRYVAGIAARDQGGLTADGYGRISYKFGGVAAAGDRGARLEGPLAPPLAETSLQIGAYLYRAALGGPPQRSHALRAGGDATLLMGRLEAIAGGWAGSDDGIDGTTYSLLAGAGVRPWPWLDLLARYEASSQGQRIDRVVGSVRAALQQNVAATVEMTVQSPNGDVGALASIFAAY